jgi:hypothetical protein
MGQGDSAVQINTVPIQKHQVQMTGCGRLWGARLNPRSFFDAAWPAPKHSLKKISRTDL